MCVLSHIYVCTDSCLCMYNRLCMPVSCLCMYSLMPVYVQSHAYVHVCQSHAYVCTVSCLCMYNLMPMYMYVSLRPMFVSLMPMYISVPCSCLVVVLVN